MNEVAINVHSLRIGVTAGDLILPNAAVAEVVSYRAPEPVNDAPAWFKGIIEWRGLRVPLVDYSQLTDRQPSEPGKRHRIASLNTLNGETDMPFMAIIMDGIPHLVQANQASLTLAENDDLPEAVTCRVYSDGEPAEIPDLDVLEKMIRDVMQSISD